MRPLATLGNPWRPLATLGNPWRPYAFIGIAFILSIDIIGLVMTCRRSFLPGGTLGFDVFLVFALVDVELVDEELVCDDDVVRHIRGLARLVEADGSEKPTQLLVGQAADRLPEALVYDEGFFAHYLMVKLIDSLSATPAGITPSALMASLSAVLLTLISTVR